MSWWLPPVIWPEDEDPLRRAIARLWRDGARHFVCNAPWQRGLFPDQLDENADLLAGPFCNAANGAALGVLASMGFSGAFVSPELPREDMLALPGQSPLPLGAVLSGYWPVGISRFGLLGVKPNEPFLSPMDGVLAVTFTRRAAEELRNRLATAFADEAVPLPQCDTLHGMCVGRCAGSSSSPRPAARQARSRQWISWRTLPGQAYSSSMARPSGGVVIYF